MSPLVSRFFRRASQMPRHSVPARFRVRPALQDLEGRIAPATLTVTNANDSGPGSLRQAILDTNVLRTADTISFAPTFFAMPQTINLTSELLISDNLAINGPGSNLLTIRPAAGVASRIFEVNGRNGLTGSGTLTAAISGMTLTGGNPADVPGSLVYGGGAVFVADEAMTVDGCVIRGNTAGDDGGGGIAASSSASLRILNSTVSDNTAGYGGGIVAGIGLLLLNSTVSGNMAIGSGGGIVLAGSADVDGVTIRNSTISGNTAGGAGGGISVRISFYAPTTVYVQNSTITNNVANGPANWATANGGGGIGQEPPNPYFMGPAAQWPAIIALQSSIVSGNRNPIAPDIGSPTYRQQPTVDAVVSAIGSPQGFALTPASANNLPFGTNLRLGPLAFNGGLTQTHALLPGSPAIDAGFPARLTTDQRGAGFPRVVGVNADIGAYEVPPVIVTSVAVNAGQANLLQRSMVTSLTVTFANLVTFAGRPIEAFQLTRTGPGGPLSNVTLTVDLSGSTATQTIARLTFSGPLTDGFFIAPSLIDGNYTLTVFSSQVIGAPPGDQTSTLFRMYGDVNGDRAVNGLDLAEMRRFFGQFQYVYYLDFNGDGIVNGLDLGAFRARYGTELP